MRFVVYGAGAIGGGIGARLAVAGHDAVLIARGAHLAAMREGGLRINAPEGGTTVEVPVAAGPEEISWRDDDVVLLTVKGQDTVAALDRLRAAAPPGVAVACVQNGVANEREALRRFENVYGVCVMMPSAHLEPGVVRLYAAPVAGNLDVGRYPEGVDGVSDAIAGAFSSATFSSFAVPDIMRWKYSKLLMNLGNAVQALCGTQARAGDLYRVARAEGEAVLAAAGIAYATREEDAERRKELVVPPPPDGEARPGGSSWQSLARGTGAIETDYLNGEIALLGRLHGIPTPVNARLQALAARAARERWEPGRLPPDEVLTPGR